MCTISRIPDPMPDRRPLRTEDPPLLRGEARYVDDLRVGQLHAVFVRSPVAAGRIVGIDPSRAAGAPGVAGVFTAADLDIGRLPSHPMLPSAFDRAPLAVDAVRFVGDPVAVVVADTRALAVDAAELVEVTLERTAATVDPRDALGAAALLAEHPTNVAYERTDGTEAGVLGGADVVVQVECVNQRVAPAPMEPDGALAVPDGDSITVWASTQRVHQLRDALVGALGVPVRVVAPQVGGGFGGKFEPTPETLVVAAVAHRLRRAVAWTQTRSENLLAMPHGRGQYQRGSLALRADGTFLGIWVDLLGDAGAYPMVGALIPNATLLMAPGPYRFARAGGEGRSAITNTTPVGAYRGAGRPEACALLERLVDRAAVELGIDPVELRRRNLVGRDEFPFTSATGMTYDSADYRGCLDTACALVDYRGRRVEQGARRARGTTPLLGIGVVMWMDCTPMNRPGEYASVTVLPDEADGVRVVVRDGAGDQGQSHRSTWAILLGETLGISPDRVDLELADTAAVPSGEGTGSARSLMLAGNAVAEAGARVREAARERAADTLEAAVDDVVLDARGFSVAGVPARAVAWRELAPITSAVDFDQPGPTFPSGAHAAVVEVDPETGRVRLVQFVAVDDCGRVVNPMVVEGQQHGGIAQGIAQALSEQVVFDDAGNLLTSTFAEYGIPSAAELPSIDARTKPTRSPVNPLGAKGIGQAGAIGSTAAVQSAVIDALAHLGVRHIDLPLTPERVWRAIPR
jgi:carbon-monoxide dehydrogenase large subunit